MFEGKDDQRNVEPGSDIGSIPKREVSEVSAQSGIFDTDAHITALIRADRFGRFKGLGRPGLVERNIRRAERATIR